MFDAKSAREMSTNAFLKYCFENIEIETKQYSMRARVIVPQGINKNILSEVMVDLAARGYKVQIQDIYLHIDWAL